MAQEFRDFFKPDGSETTETGEIFERAQSLHRDGKIEAAIALYDLVIDRHRGNAQAYYKRANAWNALGQWEAALADYDRTLAIDTDHGYACCNRGTVLERLARHAEALRSYDRAIALSPDDWLAYYNRGSVLKGLKRFREAVASYDRAIALKGDYVEAYINRANVLQELQLYSAAIASYDQAIEVSPGFVEAFQGRGVCFQKLRQFEAAIASFNQALSLAGSQKYLLGLRRYAQMQICDWTGFDSDMERLARGIEAGHPVTTPFPLLGLVDCAPLHRQAAEIWVREECPPDSALGPIAMQDRCDKIRIGYFSADFRSHAVSRLAVELFEVHDRSRFEITAFAFGPDADDSVRARLRRAFDRFTDVRHLPDIDVARLARESGIHIAVDLGGFTEYSRTKIFALRAAPLQVSYLGYLGTMAAPYMDYLVSDLAIIPDAERRHYCEKIIYLPSFQVNDSQRRIADRMFTREELGLPSTGFVFSCLNAAYKITPSVFEVWMRILKRVAQSCLFLYTDEAAAERNLRREAQRLGVDSRRLVFGRGLPLEDHLVRARTCDIFLDTLPYNAGATGSDALWAGLPVLTCAGNAFAGRVGASLLRAIDLPELIAATPAQYEDLAVRLATEPAFLAHVRRQLTTNRNLSRLFDTARFTRNLETAYVQIYERHLAGLPPEDTYLES